VIYANSSADFTALAEVALELLADARKSRIA
jgi:hypothetical protein